MNFKIVLTLAPSLFFLISSQFPFADQNAFSWFAITHTHSSPSKNKIMLAPKLGQSMFGSKKLFVGVQGNKRFQFRCFLLSLQFLNPKKFCLQVYELHIRNLSFLCQPFFCLSGLIIISFMNMKIWKIRLFLSRINKYRTE